MSTHSLAVGSHSEGIPAGCAVDRAAGCEALEPRDDHPRKRISTVMKITTCQNVLVFTPAPLTDIPPLAETGCIIMGDFWNNYK
jgi:hypothetical protein